VLFCYRIYPNSDYSIIIVGFTTDISDSISHQIPGMTYDSMCGVQGPYALRVFEKELGAPQGTCKNATPLPDFGGPSSAWHGHADPNLTYAVELVKEMGLNKEP
jgi:phosphoglucomutase